MLRRSCPEGGRHTPFVHSDQLNSKGQSQDGAELRFECYYPAIKLAQEKVRLPYFTSRLVNIRPLAVPTVSYWSLITQRPKVARYDFQLVASASGAHQRSNVPVESALILVSNFFTEPLDTKIHVEEVSLAGITTAGPVNSLRYDGRDEAVV